MKKTKLELKRQTIDFLSDVEDRQLLGGNANAMANYSEDPCLPTQGCSSEQKCKWTTCNSDCLSVNM